MDFRLPEGLPQEMFDDSTQTFDTPFERAVGRRVVASGRSE
jgi:hypothetical protein